ncbi:MAG: AraC family transcriptional regulator [Bacteroidota bacterium]
MAMNSSTTDPSLATQRAELASLIARFASAEGSHATTIEPLKLIRYARPTRPLHLQQGVALWILAQGRKELVLAEETFAHGPAECLVVSFELPVIVRVLEASPDAPCLGLALALNPAEVAAATAKHGLEEATLSGSELDRGVSIRPVTHTLLDATVRLVRLLQSPRDAGALVPLVLEEVQYRLLTGPHGALARQIARANPRLQAVAQAIAWLKANYAERYDLKALTREVGLSASALHRHFKAVTAMTPLQYQKELRLREARAQMLGEGLTAATAGYRVGYASPSQFSREYRRLFGAPPTRDIARLRANREKAVTGN